jgi:hypothetical protein
MCGGGGRPSYSCSRRFWTLFIVSPQRNVEEALGVETKRLVPKPERPEGGKRPLVERRGRAG